MKKKDILKMHGLTEQEFYKLYPTEESYIKAMGGEYKDGGSVFDSFMAMPPDFANPSVFLKTGGQPCFKCGGQHMEKGGFTSPFNYGQFPAMQMGGAFTGEEIFPSLDKRGNAPQGFDQTDVIEVNKNKFLDVIKRNTGKALKKEFREELTNYTAQYGKSITEMFMPWYKSNYNIIPYQQSYGPAYQGMNYFPMNYSPYYKTSSFSKEDKDKLRMMEKSSKPSYLSSMQSEAIYGPLDTFLSSFRGRDEQGNKKHTFAPRKYKHTYTFRTPFDPNNPDAVPSAMNDFGQSQYIKNVNAMESKIPNLSTFDPANAELRMPKAQEGMSFGDRGTSYFSNTNGYPVSADDLYGMNQQIVPTEFAEYLQRKTPELPSFDISSPDLKTGDTFAGTETQVSLEQNKRPGFNPEAMVNWGLAGADFISGFSRNLDYRREQDRLRRLQAGDNQYFSTAGNRGDYDANTGMFRPDQMVPVQFTGANLTQNTGVISRFGGSYQMGGELEDDIQELTEEEIAEIIANGGEVEFLD